MSVRVVQQHIQVVDVPFVAAPTENIHSLTRIQAAIHWQNVRLKNLRRFGRQRNGAGQRAVIEEILITVQWHQRVFLYEELSQTLTVRCYGYQRLVSQAHLLYHGSAGDVEELQSLTPPGDVRYSQICRVEAALNV